MNKEPYILDETDDYAVIYKPPKMHSVPLVKKKGSSLLEWYRTVAHNASFPVSTVDLLHRLDFETQGLVLASKNLKAREFLKAEQEKDGFIKEYSAVCYAKEPSMPASGFPAPPFSTGEISTGKPLVIESYFRPYGPGRKLVRPVIEDGKKHKEVARDNHGNNHHGFYRTEIVGKDGNVFTVRIRRGFRHQIRCHLCWIGFPILNDPLYRGKIEESGELKDIGGEREILALRACGLFFTDPSSGEKREYIDKINY